MYNTPTKKNYVTKKRRKSKSDQIFKTAKTRKRGAVQGCHMSSENLVDC